MQASNGNSIYIYIYIDWCRGSTRTWVLTSVRLVSHPWGAFPVENPVVVVRKVGPCQVISSVGEGRIRGEVQAGTIIGRPPQRLLGRTLAWRSTSPHDSGLWFILIAVLPQILEVLLGKLVYGSSLIIEQMRWTLNIVSTTCEHRSSSTRVGKAGNINGYLPKVNGVRSIVAHRVCADQEDIFLHINLPLLTHGTITQRVSIFVVSEQQCKNLCVINLHEKNPDHGTLPSSYVLKYSKISHENLR